MRVLKWYLDLIAPGGTAFVAHWTRLQIGPIVLHDGSILLRSHEGTIRRRTGRPGHAPSHASVASPEVADSTDASTIRWRSAALRLVGRWERRIAGPTVDLPAGRPGDVRWACLHAASDAEVTIDGITIRGSGYVERLELALPPWHLPISTLRWGRAVAEAQGRVPIPAGGADPQSIVWIDWRGPVPLSACGESHSGCERAERRISASPQLACITADTASLRLLELRRSARSRSRSTFATGCYRLLLVDGVAIPMVDHARIEDHEVVWAAHRLRLVGDGDALDEPLDARLRAALGPFRCCLPARIRATREVRHIGTATLERAGSSSTANGTSTVYGATWETVEFGPLGGGRRRP